MSGKKTLRWAALVALTAALSWAPPAFATGTASGIATDTPTVTPTPTPELNAKLLPLLLLGVFGFLRRNDRKR